MAQRPLVGQGLSVVEATRSLPDAPHSVVLLCTSDQPDAETSTWQHTTITNRQTYIHAAGGIRTRNPKKRAATNPRLRPRGHRKRPQI